MKQLFLLFIIAFSVFAQGQILGPVLFKKAAAVSSCPGSGNPCTDDFNRANGALGANWTADSGLSIVSNAVTDSAFTNSQGARYIGGSAFGNDQYSQVVFISGGNSSVGPLVRSTDLNNYYYMACSTVIGCELDKWVAGSKTFIAFWGGTVANGDTLRLEIIGTTITGKVVHSGTPTTVGSTTDATFASGQPGFRFEAAGATPDSIDNFQANNCSGTCPTN